MLLADICTYEMILSSLSVCMYQFTNCLTQCHICRITLVETLTIIEVEQVDEPQGLNSAIRGGQDLHAHCSCCQTVFSKEKQTVIKCFRLVLWTKWSSV